MNKTPVVIVLNRIALGGTPMRVLDLCRQLRGRSVQLCVFGIVAPDLAAEYVAAGVQLTDLGNRLNPVSYLRLARVLRRNRNAIVHAYLPFSGIVTRTLGRLLGCRTVVSNLQSVRANMKPLARVLNDATLPLSNAVVFNSDQVADSYARIARKLEPGRTHVVRNGIDVQRLRLLAQNVSRTEVRRELAIADDAFVAVCVGRFEGVKDHATILAALKQARRTHASMALLLVGWGPLENALRTSVQQHGLEDAVHFIVGRRDVWRYLVAADCFILASLHEGLSGALLEAMALGLPPVVSAIPQNASVVGTAGLCFPTQQPAALAELLMRLADDRELATSLGRAAAQRVEEAYSVESVARQVSDIYAKAQAN